VQQRRGTISAAPKQGQGEPAQDRRAIGGRMRVVATTNDPVRLTFLVALLRDAGIASVLLDTHISTVEGSIGAFPRRLAVAEHDARRARAVLREAGEA
jgi:hypothetical protein